MDSQREISEDACDGFQFSSRSIQSLLQSLKSIEKNLLEHYPIVCARGGTPSYACHTCSTTLGGIQDTRSFILHPSIIQSCHPSIAVQPAYMS